MKNNFGLGMVTGFATTAVAAICVLFIREKNKSDIQKASIIEDEMIDIAKEILRNVPTEESSEEQKLMYDEFNVSFSNAHFNVDKMKSAIEIGQEYLSKYSIK